MYKDYGNADSLTNLYNQNYLLINYPKYIKEHEKAKLLMIDLKKFKYINDTYGHAIGDKYLICFSKILDQVFEESLVIRLHGDEFCVVTDLNKEEIVEKINNVILKIECQYKLGDIPENFSFNVGISYCSDDLDVTLDKADHMMYYAKMNNIYYQFFDKKIWDTRMSEKKLLESIDEDLKLGSLTYYMRDYFNINNPNNTLLTAIATKNSQEQQVLNKEIYRYFKDAREISKVDIYNLKNLLIKISTLTTNTIVIPLDYKTIIVEENITDYIEKIITLGNMDPKNIVIAVNVNGILLDEYSFVINGINKIRNLGVQVCIDGYNSLVADNIFEQLNIEYIKMNIGYWRESMINSRINNVLLHKLDLIDSLGIKPIFPDVRDYKELDYIKTIASSDTLIGGDYIKKEVKIKLK